MRTSAKVTARRARRQRVRRRVRGTEDRPRLSVYRSGKHMYAQIISDAAGGRTVLAVSTLSPEIRGAIPKTANVEAAKQVGLLIARRCKEKGIEQVVFDRNGFIYHGRVRAVAEGAREGGLRF